MRDEVDRSSKETADARAVGTHLAEELQRIRRLAKLTVRDELMIAVGGEDEPERSSAPSSEVCTPDGSAGGAEVAAPTDTPASLDERAASPDERNATKRGMRAADDSQPTGHGTGHAKASE